MTQEIISSLEVPGHSMERQCTRLKATTRTSFNVVTCSSCVMEKKETQFFLIILR